VNTQCALKHGNVQHLLASNTQDLFCDDDSIKHTRPVL